MKEPGGPLHLMPATAPERQALLELFAPKLVFDSLETLRPTVVVDYLLSSTIVDAGGEAVEGGVAGVEMLGEDDQPSWRLNPLEGAENLNTEERSREVLEELGLAQHLGDAGTCYGRIVDSHSGALFLQYWYFYVDNPCVISFGRHDGDWEFAQVRVTRAEGDYVATHLTLDQHGKPESRPLEDGTERPTVYVAVGSHASYFDSGTNPQLPLADECDGKCAPQEPPQVEPMPNPADVVWPAWSGRWGMDRGPGTRLQLLTRLPFPHAFIRFLNHRIPAGDSPASPACQPGSWKAASCYSHGLRHLASGAGLRDVVHSLGKLTWPRSAPRVSVEDAGEGSVSVRVRPSGLGPRRVSRVAVMFEDEASGHPLSICTVHVWRANASIELPPHGRVIWRAAGYNWLRQRGNVIGPIDLDDPDPRLPGLRASEPRHLPLTESVREKGLILGDTHTKRDRRWAQWARVVFHSVLAIDLTDRGAATKEQLYHRLSWFMLPFERDEIDELLDSGRRAGIVECRKGTEDAFGGKRDEWFLTEKGEKLKRPRALSLPDLGARAVGQRAGLTTVFTSAKGVALAAFPYIALGGVGIKDPSLLTKIAVVIAGLGVLLAVLGAGVLGDLRLRAAARSWPRLLEKRPARFMFQLNYMRMAFMPLALLSVYAVGAISLFDAELAGMVAAVLLIALFVHLQWVWPTRLAWDNPDKDLACWEKEWRARGSALSR